MRRCPFRNSELCEESLKNVEWKFFFYQRQKSTIQIVIKVTKRMKISFVWLVCYLLGWAEKESEKSSHPTREI